jgi:hypothetical protein
VGDAGQREDRSASGQSPDMKAPETMLLEMSIDRLYRLSAESKHSITNFFHPVFKSLE